ncbi:hypothetical protein [Exiguobacterium sp. S22-S28]|uniref:hypothetical protein n=1 Tax=Exiguobacterium sp. S22-S28 TaxID=3342768 RepID=UPI00372D44D6
MNGIAWGIIVCEIMFWVFILAGLIVRYGWGRKRLGLRLMAMSPVIDLVLLVLTVYDLRQGTEATWAHGVAAIYIAVSLAFGKSLIAWADQTYQRFVLRKDVARDVRPKAQRKREGFFRHLTAFVIGSVLLAGMIYWIADFKQTEALLQTIQIWFLVLLVDGLIAFSYMLFPKRAD